MDGIGGIGYEVEESIVVWDDGIIGSEIVYDGVYVVFMDIIMDVVVVVCVEVGCWGLEVD